MKKRLLALSLVLLALLLVACGGELPAAVENIAAPADTAATSDIGTGPVVPAPSDGPAPRGAAATTADVAGVCMTPQEAELAQRINDYRASLGLPAIPVSKSLTLVAQQHAWDSVTNGVTGGPGCNLHSWSSNVNPALVEGTWSEVCYTSDHANAAGMWNKPREIAGFQADGGENSYWASGGATPADALEGWKNSPGHNAVITEQNGWGPRLALGVGIRGQYAHMWTAASADPAGIATVCGDGGAAPAPTDIPPTAVPAPTDVPPTAVPAPTDVPPTAVPEPTAVPPTAVPEPTAVPPTAEPAPTDIPPTAVPAPTDVPPTAEPAPTDVPPTAVPEPTQAPAPPATGEILNQPGTVAAGQTADHVFQVADGLSYTINVLPAPDFDAEPAYSCTTDRGSRSGTFDLGFEGDAETASFPINGNGTCTVTVGGYGGTGGTYTVIVTSP